MSCRNSKVLWLLNYEGKHITLGQTLNEVTDGLTYFIHEHKALQRKTKAQYRQRTWTSEKQKGEEPEMNLLKSKSEYEICQFCC